MSKKCTLLYCVHKTSDILGVGKKERQGTKSFLVQRLKKIIFEKFFAFFYKDIFFNIMLYQWRLKRGGTGDHILL